MNIPAFKFSTPEAEAAFDAMAEAEYNRHAEALYTYLERQKDGDVLGAVLALRGVDISGVLQIAVTVMEVWAAVLHEQHGGQPDQPVEIAEMARTTIDAIISAETATEASDD